MSGERTLKSPQIKEPPKTLREALWYTGPSFILSAALVGSGELIVSTTMGAKAGFTLLWFIIFSCVVKVALQVEYGKHCIVHGMPTFQAWNAKLPVGKVHWANILAIMFFGFQLVVLGGVMGGAAQSFTYATTLPVEISVVVMMLLPAILIFHGKYAPIEKLSAALNVFFTIMILYCVFAVQATEFAFSFSDIVNDFSFYMDYETFTMALGLFGITGMAAAEIVTYPYWCVEKGYAAWAGPRDDSEEWLNRARGWIRVMKLDAVLSLIIYTIATCAFYMLGAAVLSKQEEITDGNGLILQLSSVFTEVLGEWSVWIFMLCAFFVLFSTLFGATAGATRVWSDLFVVCNWMDGESESQRKRSVAILAWVVPFLWAISYLLIQLPLFLVVLWGIANSLFLVVVAYQGLLYRYQQTIPELKPGILYDFALWLAFVSFVTLSLLALINTFS